MEFQSMYSNKGYEQTGPLLQLTYIPPWSMCGSVAMHRS